VALVVVAAFPIGWLMIQLWAFGNPLAFVSATREVVRQEAAARFGTSRMPMFEILRVLQNELWGAPLVALAVVGFIRLARQNRHVFAGVLALLGLYVGMATITIGGRLGYYLNLFSMLVLPLAVSGAEGLAASVGSIVARAAHRREHSGRRLAGALLASAFVTDLLFVEVPAIARASAGDWLTEEHRQLFVLLRRKMRPYDRILIGLDPTRSSEPSHQYDLVALQLSDPGRVVVLPFPYTLIPVRKPLPAWAVYPIEKQKHLLASSGALAPWVRSQGFTRVMWEGQERAEAITPDLARTGYEPNEADAEGTGATEFIATATLDGERLFSPCELAWGSSLTSWPRLSVSSP
jgi:hypothetical protein